MQATFGDPQEVAVTVAGFLDENQLVGSVVFVVGGVSAGERDHRALWEFLAPGLTHLTRSVNRTIPELWQLETAALFQAIDDSIYDPFGKSENLSPAEFDLWPDYRDTDLGIHHIMDQGWKAFLLSNGVEDRVLIGRVDYERGLPVVVERLTTAGVFADLVLQALLWMDCMFGTHFPLGRDRTAQRKMTRYWTFANEAREALSFALGEK